MGRMTVSQMNRGSGKYEGVQISDEIQRLGAVIEAGSGLDSSTVYLSALKSKLEPSLALFSDVLLHPSFPQEDFGRQQKLQIAAIQRAKTSPGAMASRVMTPALYGKEHPYGLEITEAGVAKLTRHAIAKFHDTWYGPNNTTLGIVGRYQVL